MVTHTNRASRPNLILFALLLAGSCYSLLQSLVVPALPTLQKELGATQTGVAWVFTVFLLTACVATPLAGRLGDMFGKKRLLLAMMVGLAAGTMLAALATSLGVLIAARAIQGVGGAVFPLAFGILRDELPARRIPGGIALMSAILGLGGVVGIVLAGPIVEHLSYHWLFWIPFGAALVATVLIAVVVPESSVRAPGTVSWVAAILLAGWLVCLLLAISEAPSWGWTSTSTLALGAAALLLAVAWVWHESRAVHPLVDIDMLRLPGVWTTNVSALLIGWATYAGFVLIPQYVEAPAGAGYGFGSTVTSAGFFLLPWTIAMFIASPVSGRMSSRVGSKWPLVIGSMAATGAFVFLTFAHEHPWQFYVATAFVGAGVGLAFASMANLIVESVPQTETSVATGTNIIVRTIGGVIGTQVAVSIVASHVTATGLPAERGYLISFVISAVALCAATFVALRAPAGAAHRRLSLERRRPVPAD